jgi:serine/threonine protein kinase
LAAYLQAMHNDLSETLPEQLKSQFEVTRLLGYGRHSTLVAAHDRSTTSEVAIKLILDHSAERKLGKPGIIDKLSSIRTLRHPNILPIKDLGYASGTLYIVMPLVAGPSLEALMSQKPFSALQTCEWVAQVCRALSAAHGKGIVHGMLRPSSIFVSITDENASLLQLGGFERAILREALLDRDKYLIGTPSPYEAPEHLFDGKIGPRSDLWAAGMLAYQLVTGRLPHGASGGETLFSRMRGDPPLEFEPTVPIELRNGIARLLRTRPDLRPDSPDLVAQELDLIRRSSGSDPYWTYDVAISFAGEDRSLASYS